MLKNHEYRLASRVSRLSFIIIAPLCLWLSRGVAQPITVARVDPIPSGFTSHSSTGTVNVPCPDCNHNVTVSYDVTEGLITYVDGSGKTHQIIGCWFTFTNEDATCSAHFVVCSMVQYVAPWADENTFFDATGTGPDPYTVPHIVLKGFVENQTELIDSSVVDTCQLIIAPAMVLQGEQQSFKLLAFSVDPASRILTLNVQSEGRKITVDLVSENGSLTPLSTRIPYTRSDEHIVQRLPEIAHGVYFVVIGCDGKSIVKQIVICSNGCSRRGRGRADCHSAV